MKNSRRLPMKTATKHGLNARQIGVIRDILRPFAAEIVRADLFGSRAVGNHRDGSDIDLVLHGDIAEKTIDRLWTLFNESSLPYKVDVAGYGLIDRPSLKKHMDENARTLLTQKELMGDD